MNLPYLEVYRIINNRVTPHPKTVEKIEAFLNNRPPNENEIYKIRKSLKLSQQALADKMGISRSYVAMIENGQFKPSADAEFWKKLKNISKPLDKW